MPVSSSKILMASFTAFFAGAAVRTVLLINLVRSKMTPIASAVLRSSSIASQKRARKPLNSARRVSSSSEVSSFCAFARAKSSESRQV